MDVGRRFGGREALKVEAVAADLSLMKRTRPRPVEITQASDAQRPRDADASNALPGLSGAADHSTPLCVGN